MRVLTLGTFDLFHSGHVNLLRRCGELAGGEGLVYIGVNTDEFVTVYKGLTPTCPLESRLASCDAYGDASAHDGATQRWIEGIIDDPQYQDWAGQTMIVIGSDWASRDYLAQLNVSQSWLDLHDISVCYVPYTPGVSSTALRR